MRLTKLIRLLRRQDGISLVMAIGILAVLTISGTTLVYYSNTNARSAEYSQANGGAYDLAEAGIAHALAVLSNAPTPMTSTLLPQTTVTFEAGTATYSGVLAGTLWTITSIGKIKNPTAAANDVTRTLTRKATVYGLNSGGTVAQWSKMYHDNVSSCLTIEDVTIPVSVASRGGICLLGSGKITGATSRVEAGGNVTMTRLTDSDARSAGAGAGWTTSGNIVSSNNSKATVSVAANPGTSANLDATGFGFTIPTGSIITGIRASVERNATTANAIEDLDVFLLKAGAPSGSDKAVTGYWGTAESTRTYGTSTDLWGTTWTVAQVNASNFGLRFKVRNNLGSAQTASVDHIQITVNYKLPLDASIGLSGTPVAQADVGGTCTYDTNPAHTPCTSADKVYATTITTTPQSVAKPTIDLVYWYQNAKPGPKQNCTTGSFPGGFDNDTVLNNSRPGAPEITPTNSSYTCQVHSGGVLIGEISWNHVTHVLKVLGTIYVDGDVRFDDDGQLVNYQGRAILYATDDLEFDERVCAGGDGTNNCWSNPTSWNPADNLLVLLTGGDSEFDQGSTTPLQPSAFQGAVYAVGDCTVHEAFRLSGPILCDEILIPYDSNTWPSFYTFPSLGSLVDGQLYADPYTAPDHQVVVGHQSG